MTEKEKLGKRIKELRQTIASEDYDNQHISQQELADKSLELTKNYIGTVERGTANPTVEKLVYLGKALNLEKIIIFDIEIDVDKFILEHKKKNK